MSKDAYRRAMKTRRKVLGDEWVDAAERNKTAFNEDFQRLITILCVGRGLESPAFHPQDAPAARAGDDRGPRALRRARGQSCDQGSAHRDRCARQTQEGRPQAAFLSAIRW